MKLSDNLKTKISFIYIIYIFLLSLSIISAQEIWTKLPGPEGAWIWSSAVDNSGGAFDGTIFVGTRGGGIFRSLDNATTWQEINEGLGGFYIYDIAISSSVFTATSVGIFRSDDNGNTWQLKENGTPGGGWRTLYVDQLGNIYAGNNGAGVFYSTDNGENWSGGIGAGLTDGRIRTIEKNSVGDLFCGGFGGVHRSVDNGVNWTQIVNGMPTPIVYDLLFFMDGLDENIIATTWDYGVFKSINNGDLWVQSNNGITHHRVYTAIMHNTNDIFVGTEIGLFRSSDFGENWLPSGINSIEVSSLLNNSNNEILAGTNHSIFKSQDNGNSWNPTNSGLIGGPIFDLDVNSSNDIFLIRYEGVFTSNDNGNSWDNKNNGLIDTTYWDIKINNADDIFVGTDNGIYRSDDDGNNWTLKGLIGERVNKIAFNNNYHVFAGTYGDTSGLFRSVNNGENWTHLPNLTVDEVIALSINQNDNTIFIGHWQDGVFRSTDNGDNWTMVNNGLTNTMIQALAVSNSGYVYAGTIGGGIFRSTDNGDTWSEINNGLSDLDIQVIAINPLGNLFIGGSGEGIFYSNDNGDNWIDLNSGMPYPTIFDMILDHNNFVLAATSGGIFRSAIPSTIPNPTLSSPANGVTNIPLNPTLQWNTVFGAESYHLQVSTQNDFSNIIFDLGGIVGNTQQVMGLNGATNYYWRVRAENFIGGSDWSLIWSFTTVPLPQFILQNATNITDVSATLNGEVNPNGHDIAVGFEFGEDNSYGNFVLATPDTFNGTVNQFVYADVSGLRTNWDMHFRVVVNQVDGQFTIHGMDQTFHTQSYPTSIDISTNIPFPTYDNPSDYGAGDYRIIGLPGAKDSPYDLVNILSGEHKIAWQAYWDNGIYSDNHNDYLIEFDGSGNFRLGGGNAVWLINKGNFNINISGIQSMPTDGDDNVRINLHNGWNMITSPFVRSVPWWAIQQTNSIAVPLYEFTGGWNTSDFLNPYQGYMFDNTTNLTELIVPYRETLPKPALDDTYNWRVKIALQINELLDNSSYLGVSEYSSVGRDYLDFKKPHAVGSMPSVYFERSKWDNNYTTYATDIRPPIDELESWEIQVYANTVETAELIFKRVLDVPEKFDVILLDRVNTKYVDLRKSNSYQFNPITEITDFEILVGYRELLQNELKTLLPTEFKLGNNFPNPFNPMTTIPVSIPKDTEISLKIYNVLGQEINTIFNGFKETGNHYFRWDGTNYLNQQVAAGIYLYKLSIKNENTFVGKMVLIK